MADDCAKRIRTLIAREEPRLRAIAPETAAAARPPGKWSRAQVLGHLIDSAANNHQRFVRARAVDPFVWPGYDQRTWVSAHAYRDRSWTELVGLWAALNRHVARVIEATPTERLGTRCVIGDHEPATLEWWMQDYLRHLRHHLAQLLEE